MRPHWYPLSAISLVITGGNAGKLSLPFLVLCNREGYSPVMKLERLGVQIGLWQ